MFLNLCSLLFVFMFVFFFCVNTFFLIYVFRFHVCVIWFPMFCIFHVNPPIPSQFSFQPMLHVRIMWLCHVALAWCWWCRLRWWTEGNFLFLLSFWLHCTLGEKTEINHELEEKYSPKAINFMDHFIHESLILFTLPTSFLDVKNRHTAWTVNP